LTGQFPTTGDRFRLAYSESVSAVDYLVRTNGKDALVGLIKSYADGRTDDEAFQSAIGLSMSAFSDAWLADYGATPPTRTGPQPPPAGPVPSSWTDVGPVPGTSSSAGPAAPAATSSATASAAPSNGSSSSGASGLLAPIIVLGVVITLVAVFVARRRRDAGT